MDKLYFGIAGIPHGKKKTKMTYSQGIEYLNEIGLDNMELPFVRRINVTNNNRDSIIKTKKENNIYLSAHGSYFINLNAVEEEKRDASKKRIIAGAKALKSVGGRSLVFHPGYYLNQDKEKVFNTILEEIASLPDLGVIYRMETTGKGTQFGNIDELIEISKVVKTAGICVDFSHIHARGVGALKEYDDFARILYKIGEGLGEKALKDMHIHISGINYGDKGELNHLILEESDFNYKACLKALVDYEVKGYIDCESPNLEEDALLMKNYYNTL